MCDLNMVVEGWRSDLEDGKSAQLLAQPWMLRSARVHEHNAKRDAHPSTLVRHTLDPSLHGCRITNSGLGNVHRRFLHGCGMGHHTRV